MSILSRLRRAAVALLTPDDHVRERVDLMKAIIQMEAHHARCLELADQHINIKTQRVLEVQRERDQQRAQILALEEELSHAQQDVERLEAMLGDVADADDGSTPDPQAQELAQLRKELELKDAYIEAQRQQLDALRARPRGPVAHIVTDDNL